MNTTRTTIEANNQQFMNAFRQGDAERVANLYTQNARILPPGSDIMQGRAAIRSFWQSAMESGVKEAQLETLDIEMCGEHMAREIGRYVLTIQQGSETVKSPGKYVVIWKQEDGDWKLDVDIWNG